MINHKFLQQSHRQETILPYDAKPKPQEISSSEYDNQSSPKTTYRGTGDYNKSDINSSQQEVAGK